MGATIKAGNSVAAATLIPFGAADQFVTVQNDDSANPLTIAGLGDALVLPAGQSVELSVGPGGGGTLSLTSAGAVAFRAGVTSGSEPIRFVSPAGGTVVRANIAAGAVSFAKLGTGIVDADTAALPVAAIDPNTAMTLITAANAGDAFTLADGVHGQRKVLALNSLGTGDTAVVTPANLIGAATTITFDALGDSAELIFDGTNWIVLGVNGAVVA